MTDTALETLPSPAPVLPPSLPLPRVAQGMAFALARPWLLRTAARRYGNVFGMRLPVFGRTVIVCDPALTRQVFTASTDDLINLQPNLSRIFGNGSVFALEHGDHRARRKLLAPPFHGKSIKNYEKVIEEETLREIATWPEGTEFRTLEPMNRITLNVILRTVFGAAGAELDLLREKVPGWVDLGSRVATMPMPSRDYAQFTPWARFRKAHKEFDAAVDSLIDKALADPHFDDRTDILALLLRSRYDDDIAMSRQDISDELLTFVGAGHETTASTLGWAFERLRRHPDVAAGLVAEVDAGGSELRQATILEVQRARTVIDIAGRHVAAPSFELGPWRIPRGYSIMISIRQLHADPQAFPDPERFDPQRFVGTKPPTYAWVPFGGGTRRCIGAAFANTEMDVVLRTVFAHLTIDATSAPDERIHSKGVAFTPTDGGRVVIRRRRR